ncbi:MAG: hypothetical protein KA149_02040 [Chitinophagales bacterium]|jgi:hypothetical protein|nr:hypothetical protein [Chitinophagales bacterium]
MTDWSKIKILMGYADHVPHAISALNAKAEEERDKAYWRLDNNVIVQGGLFEAAYYVIEPVIVLLEQPYTVDRFRPLTLLAEISLGSNQEDLMEDGRTVEQACQDKLRELKSRIELIETCTAREQEEKETILENII